MAHQRLARTPLVGLGQLEHHVADMTATFAADRSFGAIQHTLVQSGQWLSIDAHPQMTIAQIICQNTTGPLRLGYGALRDITLGIQFMNNRHELITVGGRVMKNVAGYDVTKLLIGSHGRFGDIITVTTRTYKYPSKAIHVLIPIDDALPDKIIISELRPHWMLRLHDCMILGYHGNDQAIAFYDDAVRQLNPINVHRATMSEDIALRSDLWICSGFRAIVPPASVPVVLQDISHHNWSADPVFGIIVGSEENLSRDALIRAVTAVGGSVIFSDSELHPAPSADIEQLINQLTMAFA